MIRYHLTSCVKPLISDLLSSLLAVRRSITLPVREKTEVANNVFIGFLEKLSKKSFKLYTK